MEVTETKLEYLEMLLHLHLHSIIQVIFFYDISQKPS